MDAAPATIKTVRQLRDRSMHTESAPNAAATVVPSRRRRRRVGTDATSALSSLGQRTMSVLSRIPYGFRLCIFACMLTHSRTHARWLVVRSFVRPFSPRVRTYVAARAQRSLGRAAGKFGRFRGRFCYGTTGVKEPDGEGERLHCGNASMPALLLNSVEVLREGTYPLTS